MCTALFVVQKKSGDMGSALQEHVFYEHKGYMKIGAGRVNCVIGYRFLLLNMMKEQRPDFGGWPKSSFVFSLRWL